MITIIEVHHDDIVQIFEGDFLQSKTLSPLSKANVMKVDLDDLHLVEGDVSNSVGGVKGRHRHLSPGGGVGQGNMVGAVRHEHSRVGHILWKN